MDRWVDRWMDGWMGRWVDGWMDDGWVDGCLNTLKTLMDFSDLLRTSGDFSSARTVVPETPEPVLSSNQNIVFKAKKTKQRRVPARLSVPLSLKQPPAEPCEASQAPQGQCPVQRGCHPETGVHAGAPAPKCTPVGVESLKARSSTKS